MLYEPLHEPTSFRLFHLTGFDNDGVLQASLKSSHVDFSKGYIALSYAWGPEDVLTNKTIKLNGELVRVRQNLGDFLHAWSSHTGRHEADSPPLWIDALCIDQSNIPERNQQVHLMANIFRSAKKVLVWLGFPDVASHVMTQESAAYAHRQVSRRYNPPDQHNAFKDICCRSYFERLWIVQELGLAQNAEIFTGSSCIPWTLFARSIFKSGRRFQHTPASRLCTWHSQWQLLQPGTKDMLSVIRGLESQQCEDIRDRLYGLQGLVDGGDTFPIDYALDRPALWSRALHHFGQGQPTQRVRTLAAALLKSLNLTCSDLKDQCLSFKTVELLVGPLKPPGSIIETEQPECLQPAHQVIPKGLDRRTFGVSTELAMCAAPACRDALSWLTADLVVEFLTTKLLWIRQLANFPETFVLYIQAIDEKVISESAPVVPSELTYWIPMAVMEFLEDGCRMHDLPDNIIMEDICTQSPSIDPERLTGGATIYRFDAIVGMMPDETTIRMRGSLPLKCERERESRYTGSYVSLVEYSRSSQTTTPELEQHDQYSFRPSEQWIDREAFARLKVSRPTRLVGERTVTHRKHAQHKSRPSGAPPRDGEPVGHEKAGVKPSLHLGKPWSLSQKRAPMRTVHE